MSDHHHENGSCPHCGQNHPESPPPFPTEITFKVIFRQGPHIRDMIRNVLSEKGLEGDIQDTESRKGTFISYTITAVFPSEEILQSTCSLLSGLNGFITMF